MSLAIDADRVAQVLLADGWHDVEAGTFGTDAYEIGEYRVSDHDFYATHRGGEAGVCATGFSFREVPTGRLLFGPLTAVLALAYEAVKPT